tara:strand:- start:174 stop:443 length:270 start_codon:yes stop_codon:yes gene_type:complete
LSYKQFKDFLRLKSSEMYNCRIYHDFNEEIVLLDINVETLKELAEELDMTYQQVADLNSRKGKRKYQQFKYCPKIEINPINRKEIFVKL